MSYKDKDKQREANRQAKAKQRAKKAYNLAIELGMTPKGMTNRKNVIPCDIPDVIPKRGKDIKCFKDLPPHVQQTIDMMSTTDGKLDKTIKANRTAIAINYQHQFPDRYHSTGVV